MTQMIWDFSVQQMKSIIAQLAERVIGADALTKAVDTCLTIIADGTAERYENTLRDIRERLYALETLARKARPPQPQPPPNYNIGSPSEAAADAAEQSQSERRDTLTEDYL